MHEWALAEAVLDTVRAKQKEQGGLIPTKVTVSFGELQSIDPDVFAEGIRHLQDDADDLDLDFEFRTEPATFSCTACGHSWALADSDADEDTREAIHFLPEVVHTFIGCPSCSSADFRVERGRGVTIDSIEFAETDDRDTGTGHD